MEKQEEAFALLCLLCFACFTWTVADIGMHDIGYSGVGCFIDDARSAYYTRLHTYAETPSIARHCKKRIQQRRYTRSLLYIWCIVQHKMLWVARVSWPVPSLHGMSRDTFPFDVQWVPRVPRYLEASNSR